MTLREPKSSSSSDPLAEVSSPATPRDLIGEMSIKACQVEHADDPLIDPHAMVRFSQLDMDAVTKPLHIEIERLKGAASPATPANRYLFKTYWLTAEELLQAANAAWEGRIEAETKLAEAVAAVTEPDFDQIAEDR